MNLCNHLHEPTRGKNILDLVFSNDLSLVQNFRIGDSLGNSDHNSVLFEITTPSNATITPLAKLNWSKADFIKMSCDLELINWPLLFSECSNIDELWDCFESNCLRVINESVPRFSARNPNRRPFLPNKIKNILSAKRKCFKNRWDSQFSFSKYKQLVKRSKKILKNHQFEREQKLITQPDKKQFFKYVNNKLKSRPQITSLSKNGQNVTTPVEQANVLNDQFCSVFTKDDGLDVDCNVNCTENIDNVFICRKIVEDFLKELTDSPSCQTKARLTTSISPLRTIQAGLIYYFTLEGDFAFVSSLEASGSVAVGWADRCSESGNIPFDAEVESQWDDPYSIVSKTTRAYLRHTWQTPIWSLITLDCTNTSHWSGEYFIEQ